MAEKTIAERRIEVLQDALDQVRLEKYKATPRKYVDAYHYIEGVTLECKIGQVARSLDERKQGEFCQVCADGALLLSSLRKGNSDHDVSAVSAGDNTKRLLRKHELFSEDQFSLMEAYFEGDSMYTDVEDRKIGKWNGSDDARTRMIRIFENAIKNNGIFKPDKE